MAISVADNFSYKGTKPLDARTKYDSVADMKNATTSDLYDGCLAYVVATKKNYQYDSSNEVDPDTGKWRELETGGGGSTYTAGDGIDITNDVISTDNMPDTDMSEIVTPLPGTMSRRAKYSTTEQIVGEWLDGKPIYQQTISCGGLKNNAVTTKAHDISNIERIINLFGFAENASLGRLSLPNVSPISTSCIGLGATTSEITISTGSDRTAFTTTYVTIQYTKTTDQANS